MYGTSRDGQKGMFPGNYVEKIEPEPYVVIEPDPTLEVAPAPTAKRIVKKASASLPEKEAKKSTPTRSPSHGGAAASDRSARPVRLQYALLSNFMGLWTCAMFILLGAGSLVWSMGAEFTAVRARSLEKKRRA